MLSLDLVTRQEYDAAGSTTAKASAVVSALASPVSIKVYSDPNTVVGSGTMRDPWASVAGNVITIGGINDFEVTSTDTPDSNWFLRFESGNKWLKGTFALTNADFTWSLGSWEAGQVGESGNPTGIIPKTNVSQDSPSVVFDIATNLAPYWTVPDGYELNALTTGSIFDLVALGYAVDPEGDPMIFGRTAGTAPGSVTVSADGVLTVPAGLAPDSYSVVVDLQAANAAEQDWQTRTQNAEWSHRFQTEDEFTKWRVYDTSKLNAMPTTQIRDMYINCLRWEQGTGYNGGNALVMEFPVTPDGVTEPPAGSWERPFGVQPGDNGFVQGRDYYIPPEHLTPEKSAWNVGQSVVWTRRFRGGLYGHTSYHSLVNPPSGTGTRPTYTPTAPEGAPYGQYDSQLYYYQWKGTEFYLQFRVHISSGRDAVVSVNTNPKLAFLTTGRGGRNEWVLNTPQYSGASGSPPNTTYRSIGWYTNFSNQWNARLGSVVGVPSCNTFTADRRLEDVISRDQWVTVLLHFKGGRSVGGIDDDRSSGVYTTDAQAMEACAAAGLNNTTVRVYVADAGATSYTLISETINWCWAFGGDLDIAQFQAYGTALWPDRTIGPSALTLFAPSMYLNNARITTPFTVKYSEVIFSKQFIPCPQV